MTRPPGNRVTTETNELSKTRTFQYDAVGNLTERVVVGQFEIGEP